jgi:hypothetical protein
VRPVISICLPYHDNPQMLARQFEHYYSPPRWVRESLELIVCDDASNTPAKFDPTCPVTTRIFRIDPPHVAWSHRCATNIAAHYARGEWLLLTDIDHLVDYRALQHLVVDVLSYDPEKVYTFRRRNSAGEYVKPHPDSWLIHRDMWQRIGGWDERYRGLYGQNARIWDRVRRFAGEPIPLPFDLITYDRRDVPDANSDLSMYRTRVADKQKIHELQRTFKRDGTYFDSHQLTVPHDEVKPC